MLEWGTQISSFLTYLKNLLGTNALAYSKKEKRFQSYETFFFVTDAVEK